MESDLWRGFLAVAEHRNFTAAASTLPVSQSGLSQQIRRLESLLGVSLFERTTREVRLSSSGAGIITDVRALIGAEDELLARMRSARDEAAAKQVLTVFVIEDGVGHLLIDLVERARHRIPGLRVEVEQIGIGEQSAVLATSTDAAVLIGRPPFSSTLDGARRTVLADDALCLVVPAQFDLPDRITVEEALGIERRAMPWLPGEWQAWSPLLASSEQHSSDVMVANNFKDAIQSVGIDERPCVAPQTIATGYVVASEAKIVELVDGPRVTIELVSTAAEPLVSAFHAAATDDVEHDVVGRVGTDHDPNDGSLPMDSERARSIQ